LVILLVSIVGYSIGVYCWLFYWWLLMSILLVVIGVYFIGGVATLALGSRPRQRFARLRAKKEAQESDLMLLRV